MLHLYYTNLTKGSEKNNFIAEIMEKCRVNYPTVRSWISNPATRVHRTPKPLYRGIIAEITGIQENELFPAVTKTI